MNYEKIKSIVLTLLVAMSIFLTWNLWTYQPEYDVIESTEAFDVSIGEERKVLELVQPYKVFYYHDDQISGTPNESEIDKVLEQMSSWRLTDAKDISNQFSQSELDNLVHRPGIIDLVFPDSLPLTVYNQVIKFDDQNLPKTSFNRILFDINTKKGDKGIVYFVLYGDDDREYVVEAKVDGEKMDSLKDTFVQRALYNDNFRKYYTFKVNARKTILLPIKEEEYYGYKYSTEQLEAEDFMKALFNDPNNVSRNLTDSEEIYRDSSSLMKVNTNVNSLSFVNPGVDPDPGITEELLVHNSVEFVNEHGGWTDQFKLFSVSPEESKIEYRMFLLNFPVFSDIAGTTEISQVWGMDTIHKYQRPFFQIGDDYSMLSEPVKVQLPSGFTVQQTLEENKMINLDFVEDIAIGYKLTRDMNFPDMLLYDLTPSWYYKYSGNWLRLPLEEMGAI
ncbi:YycH family regulatory protein [Bacillus sp. Marseille-Q1617]|uniref:YycH family regulatory protein n=1 Tax=Bacillus sp. Marseille-Q1617 TaxID=2736887 RepID=UPI00158F30F6|nr:two-component system activity regulator YycH [Bacillus sp. Marseille-Q1617]